LRRPKHTVQPATRSKINEAKFNQNPGAVVVFDWTLGSFSTWCLTKTNKAMSMANAINVMSAARKEVKEDNNVKVTCVEKDRRKATNITAVATGWTARPRVHEGPMMTPRLLSWGLDIPTE